MATNTNNGDGGKNLMSLQGVDGNAYRHTYYIDDDSVPADKEDRKVMTIITCAVFVGTVLLLRFLCFCFRPGREEQDAGGNRAGELRPPRRGSEEAGGRVGGAPPAAVEVAPVRAVDPPLVCAYRKADGWAEKTCPVCLAELADGEVVRVLPACLHYFHAACVNEWLRAHATCPLCRAPLLPAQGGDGCGAPPHSA